jgi:hypothetical protein
MPTTLQTLYRPYEIAGCTVSEFAISTYETLTSQQAQRVYRDAWTITRVVAQVTALALYASGLYTIIAGHAFRRYYEAEWSADVQRFLSYPDRCIDEGVTDETEALEIATTTPVEASVDIIPEAVQTILDSDCKMTKKLREIASYYGISWRNARGKGKHLRNGDIRALLSPYSAVLAAL